MDTRPSSPILRTGLGTRLGFMLMSIDYGDKIPQHNTSKWRAVKLIYYLKLVSFLGFPRFCSSVCTQYNTHGSRLKSGKKQGRPGNTYDLNDIRFCFRVLNFCSWSRPQNHFNSEIFLIYGIITTAQYLKKCYMYHSNSTWVYFLVAELQVNKYAVLC